MLREPVGHFHFCYFLPLFADLYRLKPASGKKNTFCRQKCQPWREHEISVNEAGLDIHCVEVKQQAVVFQRRTLSTGVSRQPHKKTMLQTLQPRELTNGSSTPNNASILEHRPDMSVECTHHCLMVKHSSARTVGHLHTTHQQA